MKKQSQNPAQEDKERQIIFFILCGSKSKSQTIRALNQIGERVIGENLKDQYLIKENKGIAVGKHFLYQFGLIVLDFTKQ